MYCCRNSTNKLIIELILTKVKNTEIHRNAACDVHHYPLHRRRRFRKRGELSGKKSRQGKYDQKKKVVSYSIGLFRAWTQALIRSYS
jgi:hypothetical protein